MQPIEISSYEDFKAYEGQELGVSDWHTIDQKQVNMFFIPATIIKSL